MNHGLVSAIVKKRLTWHYQYKVYMRRKLVPLIDFTILDVLIFGGRDFPQCTSLNLDLLKQLILDKDGQQFKSKYLICILFTAHGTTKRHTFPLPTIIHIAHAQFHKLTKTNKKFKAHLHPRVIAVVCFYFDSLYCLNAWSDWLNALKLFEKAAISSRTLQLQTTIFIYIHRIYTK